MTFARGLLGLAALILVMGGSLLGQDKKDTAKAKGTLPQNWSKIGLTDAQKQDIYKVQTEYRGKIEDLQAQIKKLQNDERAELQKVLTDAQKARLKEILLEKAPGEDKTPKKDKAEKTDK